MEPKCFAEEVIRIPQSSSDKVIESRAGSRNPSLGHCFPEPKKTFCLPSFFIGLETQLKHTKCSEKTTTFQILEGEKKNNSHLTDACYHHLVFCCFFRRGSQNFELEILDGSPSLCSSFPACWQALLKSDFFFLSVVKLWLPYVVLCVLVMMMMTSIRMTITTWMTMMILSALEI